MSVDILPSDVGYKALKAILLSVEDNARLGAMLGAAILLGAEEYAKFQRHVESRQRRVAVRFRSRDIVNTIAAFLNDLANLVEPIVGGIVGFECTSRYEARPNNGKDDGIEIATVLIVKRAVDEDVAVRISCHADYLVTCGSATPLAGEPLRSCSIVALISLDVKCVGFDFGDRIVTPSESLPASL